MFMGTQLIGFGAGGAGAATITMTDHAVDPTDLTVYTFNTRAIGTAAADRYVIVGSGCQAAAARTATCKIATNAATQVVTAEGSGGGAFCRTSFWILNVTSGTTADIEVTFSGACVRAACGVWVATGLNSSTATATASSTANPGNASISCDAGGIIVGYHNVFSGAATSAWTNLTERFDETIEGGVCCSTGASDAFVAAQSGLSITSTPSAFTGATLLLAAFS